jgi:hybrid cluster-associated redox disulfide protein
LRQRKDKYDGKRYSISMMEPQQISQCWTVSEILQKYPETRRIFIERKTLCLGCYIARFCNLKDVAKAYGLEIETLVHEIQNAAINQTNQNSKE